MKILIITITIALMGSLAHGLEKQNANVDKKVTTAEITKKIKVHGMACPMCQSKAESKFKENKDIKNVNVDMDKMLITLNLHPGKDLPVKKIKPIVESLGLSFVEIVK